MPGENDDPSKRSFLAKLIGLPCAVDLGGNDPVMKLYMKHCHARVCLTGSLPSHELSNKRRRNQVGS